MHTQNTPQSGFTLVELLVTIAVLAIVLALGVPGYAKLVNHARLSSTTNDLISALALARSEAIRRGVRVTVCKSAAPMSEEPVCQTRGTWQTGWIAFVDRNQTGQRDSDDQLLRVWQGTDRASISASNFNTYVSYMPDGRSRGPNNLATGSLTICLAGNQRKIILNSTGRVRLQKELC